VTHNILVETHEDTFIRYDLHMTEAYFTEFLAKGIAAADVLQKDDVPLTPDLCSVVAADSQMLNCVYWCIAGLTTLGKEPPDQVRDAVIQFYHACMRPRGEGFAPGYRQDAHILATASGFQLSRLLKLPTPPCPRTHILSTLLQDNGSFIAYDGGEEDIRFVYAALLSLRLENVEADKLCYDDVPRERTIGWVRSCQNVDGGFGCSPGLESHAGHTFCALAALRLCDHTLVGRELARCSRWLLSRQVGYDSEVKSGLNGRIGKEPDSCYTFWVLAAAKLLGLSLERAYDLDALRAFVTSCGKDGGISKGPDQDPDPFHSFFALVGLGILEDTFDPLIALPVEA